jgi:hypothetical protein
MRCGQDFRAPGKGPADAFVQYLSEAVGPVRDDAVHTPVEQSLHVRALVNRPDVHQDVPGVQRADERWTQNLPVAQPLGGLHDVSVHSPET